LKQVRRNGGENSEAFLNLVQASDEFGMDAALRPSTRSAALSRDGQDARLLETGRLGLETRDPSFTFGERPMTKLLTAATKFAREEEGATLAEYGLLLALIAVICIVAIAALGTKISTMLSTVAGGI
jgi:pilus assembly protein Flp/PilA